MASGEERKIDAAFVRDGGPPALDVNGEPIPGFTEADIQTMIRVIESTGRYDVVGRRW